MANSQRTTNSITRRAIGSLLAALLCSGALIAAALPSHEVREDIEWLDVWLPHTNDHDLGDPALLSEVELILRNYSADVIHFNNGLHGSEYTEQQYAEALPALLAVFKRTAPKARLIWASSTDVVGSRQPKDLTLARIIARNRLAATVVAQQGIAVDDLFSVVKDHADYHLADGVHFTPQGYATLAAQVAASAKSVLP
jgi:lysophospholipase L1-like esterase